jgi:hypothetical protein
VAARLFEDVGKEVVEQARLLRRKSVRVFGLWSRRLVYIADNEVLTCRLSLVEGKWLFGPYQRLKIVSRPNDMSCRY